MAIQIPNPGTGNGTTGDNEFVMWTKVKDNFTNQSHAASRLVGTENEHVPVNKDVLKIFLKSAPNLLNPTTESNINNLTSGSYYILDSVNPQSVFTNAPPLPYPQISTQAGFAKSKIQIAYSYYNTDNEIWVRQTDRDGIYSNWSPLGKSKSTYTTTTAAGANVVVDNTGKLMRSTSSERYKDILADLELDDAAYRNAMQLAPIVYRSTAEADNPDYHYYSFSAEALGAYDPAFTLWRETETVTDDEGNVTEQPLAERIAEGINLNAIVAFLHATNVKQGALITEQAEAIETLTKRIDELTAK